MIRNCRKRYDNVLWCIDPKTLDKIPVHLYEMCENHNAIFGGYMVSCDWKLPNGRHRETPPYVFVQHSGSLDNCSSFTHWQVKIMVPIRVCLAADVQEQHSAEMHTATKLDVLTGLHGKSASSIEYLICMHTPLHGDRYQPEYVAEYIELQVTIGHLPVRLKISLRFDEHNFSKVLEIQTRILHFN